MDIVPNEASDRPKNQSNRLKCIKLYLNPEELSDVMKLMQFSDFSSIGLWLKHVIKSYGKVQEFRINEASKLLDWDFSQKELGEARRRLIR